MVEREDGVHAAAERVGAGLYVACPSDYVRFSERIFSYGGEQSSGKRSSISVKRLNARELCKFNFSRVPEEEWYHVTVRMEEILKSNTDFGYNAEEVIVDNVLKKSGQRCPHCICIELTKMKNTSRTAGVVRGAG